MEPNSESFSLCLVLKGPRLPLLYFANLNLLRLEIFTGVTEFGRGCLVGLGRCLQVEKFLEPFWASYQ